MSELWYPQATRRPGPEWKQGYGDVRKRLGKGGVFHSAEGPLDVMLSILDGAASKSWTLSNPKTGPLLQHYPLEAVTWHAGATANRLYFGVEHEGMQYDHLTDSQVENDIGLLRWAGEVEGWPEFSRASTLREHNEFMATVCPSGRIPWDRIIAALNVRREENTMGQSITVPLDAIVLQQIVDLYQEKMDAAPPAQKMLLALRRVVFLEYLRQAQG